MPESEFDIWYSGKFLRKAQKRIPEMETVDLEQMRDMTLSELNLRKSKGKKLKRVM